MIATLLLVGSVQAQELAPAFHDAAEEFQVPEKVLLALAYESSRWQPHAESAWGGHGLFDLGTQNGPDLTEAAWLLGLSTQELIDHPEHNIRGAAALLADHALAKHGDLPPSDQLLAWWDATVAFYADHEPHNAARFAGTVFEHINFGVDGTSLSLAAEPVDHWSLVPVAPPGAACDYSDCASFTPASSANYTNSSRSAGDIDYIVIHTVQGSYSGCISWFQNSAASVSAHYVIQSSDGEVTQMVDEADIAWHAGNWDYNAASVGIEHEGYVDEPEVYYTDAMYASSAALSADIAVRNGIPIDRDHIIAHSEVPEATHTDPGSGWDWDRYIALVESYAGGETTTPDVTGNLIGVIADSDIYEGQPLVDAEVWISETGEGTSTDGSGYYLFTSLPLGDYTVHATAEGYDEGTCTKTLTVGDNWCSIALYPLDEDPGTDTGVIVDNDTGTATDTGATTDTGAIPDTGGEDPSVTTSGTKPGIAVRNNELSGGCGCATGSGNPTSAWLVLLGLLIRRRRED